MLNLRKSGDRGRANHGWLDARHSFSFAGYFDPRHMGFRTLRVINQDIVSPGAGFPPHSHNDMEIITYVMRGEIEHQDSMGNKARIKPGEIQVMSAGSGVTHSEYNPSSTEPLELLQIWILPRERGLTPGYAQRALAPKEDGLRLIASPDGRAGSLTIHQDAFLSAGKLRADKTLAVGADPKRHYWLQVVNGRLRLGDVGLESGDGLAISDEQGLTLDAQEDAEILLFDLG